MVETETERRPIISSSGWWIWIILIVIILIVIAIGYGIWRFFTRTTEEVKEEVGVVTQPVQEQPQFRIVRTDTEIILIDDPIIPEGEVAVEDIEEHPGNFLGQTVTISGSVTDYTSPAFFSVNQSEGTVGVFAIEDVIQLNELETAANPEAAYVRVSGIVKRLTREREKTEFGLSFEDLDEAVWQDRIVIEATSIQVITPTTT